MKPIILSFLLIFTLLSCRGDRSKNTVVTKESENSINITYEKFINILGEKGLTLFAVIDHKKNAQGVDMELTESRVIIFGNPKGGTLIMQEHPQIALDLPLKVLIWEDKAGKVFLSYTDPVFWAKKYDIGKEIKKASMKMSKALNSLISVAAEKE